MTTIFGIVYLLFLMLSITERQLSRNFLRPVLIGLVFSSLVTFPLVSIIAGITSYNYPETVLSSFVLVPLVEESSKLLGIFLSFYLLKKFFETDNQMIVRMGGSVGLGFGILEAFIYIFFSSANLMDIFERIVVSVPAHMSIGMFLAMGLTQKSKVSAISFISVGYFLHSLSNMLSASNHLLQGFVFWVILVSLYFLLSKKHYTIEVDC
ncbi:MAG: PrsW family glutamic-type intramembrane protease [Candidatus Bathyarchaeota archaeon]|jgi:RsiW-degrading membrane proteinase PrsW (M82 family)